MLKASHMKIASKVLDIIQGNIDWKINKTVYLIGSVLPDLNCVYPTHTVRGTYSRFRNRLSRVDISESVLIKSFTLGVITHYICDYFCYAHNIYRTDPKHAIYERFMRKHIKTHEATIVKKSEELEVKWQEFNKQLIYSMEKENNIEDVIKLVSEKGNKHIEYIMELMSNMHNSYIEKTNTCGNIGWYTSSSKIELDLEYATFMCEKIAMILLNPIEVMGMSV